MAEHAEAEQHGVVTSHDDAHSGAHHAPFSMKAALEHHNGPYPAIEWVHNKPILIFNAEKYATLKAKHGEVHSAEYWSDQALMTMPSPLSFFNNQTFFGTIALLLMFLLIGVFAKRKPEQEVPQGRVQNLLEAIVKFIRDEVVRPNIHHGEKWTAHIVCLFLAILSFNLMGLIPGGGTASGNPGVTTGFAVTTLLTMLFFGMKEQGVAAYWVNLVPVSFTFNPIGLFTWVLLAIIELMGLLIKPTALAIRLFANMFAGHTVLLAFTSLGFLLQASGANDFMTTSLGVAGFFFAVAIYFLELLVALIQAYVFTLLSSVFIGMSVHPEH